MSRTVIRMCNFFTNYELYPDGISDGYSIDSDNSFFEAKQQAISKIYSAMSKYTSDPIFDDYSKFRVEFKNLASNYFIGYITYDGNMMYYISVSDISIIDYKENFYLDIMYRGYIILIHDTIVVETENFKVIHRIDSYDDSTIGNNQETRFMVYKLLGIVDKHYENNSLPAERIDMHNFNKTDTESK